jgi:hypothetical protein
MAYANFILQQQTLAVCHRSILSTSSVRQGADGDYSMQRKRFVLDVPMHPAADTTLQRRHICAALSVAEGIVWQATQPLLVPPGFVLPDNAADEAQALQLLVLDKVEARLQTSLTSTSHASESCRGATDARHPVLAADAEYTGLVQAAEHVIERCRALCRSSASCIGQHHLTYDFVLRDVQSFWNSKSEQQLCGSRHNAHRWCKAQS